MPGQLARSAATINCSGDQLGAKRGADQTLTVRGVALAVTGVAFEVERCRVVVCNPAGRKGGRFAPDVDASFVPIIHASEET